MALTAQQLTAAWHDAVEEAPALAQAFTKPNLQAAAAAVDAWIDANQASYVASLPEPFKTTSTAAQKSLLFMWVLIRRFRG